MCRGDGATWLIERASRCCATRNAGGIAVRVPLAMQVRQNIHGAGGSAQQQHCSRRGLRYRNNIAF